MDTFRATKLDFTLDELVSIGVAAKRLRGFNSEPDASKDVHVLPYDDTPALIIRAEHSSAKIFHSVLSEIRKSEQSKLKSELRELGFVFDLRPSTAA